MLTEGVGNEICVNQYKFVHLFFHVEIHFTQIGGFDSIKSASKNSSSFLLKYENLIRKFCPSIMATDKNHTLINPENMGATNFC
jgi:hypothetical protein